MTYFAKVVNNIVEQVISADQSFINSGAVGDANAWLQTYTDGTIRKNFAGIGFVYDAKRDAFIPPQPYFSWSLNKNTCRWEPPVKIPIDGKMYAWDEKTKNWVSQ